MFGNKTRPETLRVGDEGLYRIIKDLLNSEGLIGFGNVLQNGLNLNIRPAYSDGQFLENDWVVYLNARDTEILLNKLPRRTLQDQYGRKE